MTILDDDRVDATNLHRQTLYTEADVGEPKADVAVRKAQALTPYPADFEATAVRERFLPDTALARCGEHDLVLDGSDNYATKFLVADATKLAKIPCVQAGAVRFGGWAMASTPHAGACMRCLFEDLPRGHAETCAVTGVLGPVVAVLGAIEAALAIQLLLGAASAASVLFSYDALAGRMRKRRLARRSDCPLCTGQLQDVAPDRYLGTCAA